MVGDETRTDLANDRTVLAWTRTSLTCILGGAAFAKLGADSDEPRGLSSALAFFLFGSGLWLMGTGWYTFHEERRSLGLTHKFGMAADSTMIIVTVLCIFVTIWAIRLR
jgi:uncharacterized membrane protein YidH (DUF202 family)